MRETTHRFTAKLQPAEDVERTGMAVRAKGVDTPLGHRGNGVVAVFGRLPTGATSVADGKDQDALFAKASSTANELWW